MDVGCLFVCFVYLFASFLFCFVWWMGGLYEVGVDEKDRWRIIVIMLMAIMNNSHNASGINHACLLWHTLKL